MESFVDTLHQMPSCSQLRKWFKFMFITTFGRFCNVFIVLAVIIVFLYGENIWGGTHALTSSAVTQTHHVTCVWKEGDPQLFHLKTTSGVHYDGGHWFHVAENFMTQHTLLRQRQQQQGMMGLATSSDVYISMDREGFLSESNSMTRFMLGLGLTNGLFKYLHFVYAPVLDLSHANIKPGDSLYLSSKSVTSQQVQVDL